MGIIRGSVQGVYDPLSSRSPFFASGLFGKEPVTGEVFSQCFYDYFFGLAVDFRYEVEVPLETYFFDFSQIIF